MDNYDAHVALALGKIDRSGLQYPAVVLLIRLDHCPQPHCWTLVGFRPVGPDMGKNHTAFEHKEIMLSDTIRNIHGLSWTKVQWSAQNSTARSKR